MALFCSERAGLSDANVVDLDGDDLGATTGVMPRFLSLIHARLRAELSKSNPLPTFESKWLLGHLKENEWWMKAGKARWVLKQLEKWLGQDSSNSVNEFKATLEQLCEGFVGAYFRDIFVWLPDVRWDGMMPVCPECESSKCVVPHSWRYDSLARRVQSSSNH